MRIEHCFMGDQCFLWVISMPLICTHRYIGKFMAYPIKSSLLHQYTKWSESRILCSLILSEISAKRVLVFTLAVEKSFFECPWPRSHRCCCLWEEQLRHNYNLTSALPWHDSASKNLPGLAKQKYVCHAFVQGRKLGIWMQQAFERNEQNWDELLKVKWAAVPNYSVIEWLPTCCEEKNTKARRLQYHFNEGRT